MHPKLRIFLSTLAILVCNHSFGQREGFFIAPQIFTGFNYIEGVYHTNPNYAPANKGYNVMFNFGATAGYKLKTIGLASEIGVTHFQQNFKQNNLEGDLQLNYNSFGLNAFYQFERIKSGRFYHTVKLGYQLNSPQRADYIVKNSLDNTIYADTSQLGYLKNDHMIIVGYGITTGYKLLWADFSVKAGYSLGNIYNTLPPVKGKNFFLGFGLSFGLFVNTNK